MKKSLLIGCLLFFQMPFFAQQDAWVYLIDKEDVAFSIANPLTILTQKALERKIKYGVPIDERDVPVNENYITQLKNVTGITVLAKSKWFNAVHIRGSESDILALKNLGCVESIEFADKNVNGSKMINQKRISKFGNAFSSFNYGNASNQVYMIKAHELHQRGYSGEGMTVAVIDAGFPYVNTMLAFQKLRNDNQIKGGYDFVNRMANVYDNTSSEHGTWVLSTMAGYLENQYKGTAPEASYYLFITEDALSENPVEESYWVEAVERSDSLGVDVINTSLGYKLFDNPAYNHSNADLNGFTTFITKGANIAFEKGLLLINSAGNEGGAGINAPADSPNVLAVGAVNSGGGYASFSSVGSVLQPTQKPDVVAQGQASFVVGTNDVIGTLNGTSFSSPILAGGIVCLWQALPYKSNAEIMQLIRESASQYNNPDYFLGYGIPNLFLALDTELQLDDEGDDQEDIILYPNPSAGVIYFKLPSHTTAWNYTIYDVLGRQISNLPIFNQVPIDISSLKAGMYWVKLESPLVLKNFTFIKK